MSKIKMLISGLPNSGKTSLLQTLDDVLVFARDGKNYPFPQPHINIDDFESVDELINTFIETIEKYESKFGKLPKTIVIDSISKILLDIEGNILSTVKSFPYGVVNVEIKKLSDFIQRDLIPTFNVIFVSHAIYNTETLTYDLVNAGGSYGKKGGVLSEVDHAIFVEIKSKSRIIHFNNAKMLSRTLLSDVPETVDSKDFKLSEFVEQLENLQNKAEEWSL